MLVNVCAVLGEARRAVHLRLTSDSRPNSGQVAKPSIARTTLVPKLNRLNLGVEAWVVLFESGQAGTPNRDTYSRTLLGYARLKKAGDSRSRTNASNVVFFKMTQPVGMRMNTTKVRPTKQESVEMCCQKNPWTSAEQNAVGQVWTSWNSLAIVEA